MVQPRKGISEDHPEGSGRQEGSRGGRIHREQGHRFSQFQAGGKRRDREPGRPLFSGDQIYEGVGGYGIHRSPVDLAVLNYLRKIYLWGWAFRDLMRDRPTLALPDDHGVYQGNIWGAAGRDCGGIKGHSEGGYAMHEDFVNAVQRTQTAHHPAPFDPTPVERGIGVYYGDMIYGRVGFAILEDRKFKSGPAEQGELLAGTTRSREGSRV